MLFRSISPQNDIISQMGQDIPIPSNISLPKQWERYAFFTITLDKPNYRLYFGQKGPNKIASVRGRFPFKATVDAIRNGSEFYQLINSLNITGGGVRDLDIQGNSVLNIPSNELNFTDKKKVTAPAVRGDEIFVAVSVANQSGYMIPTDVKSIASGKSLNLNALPGSDQQVVGLLKKTDEFKSGNDRMSAALVKGQGEAAPKVLPLIADPSIMGQNEIAFPSVSTIDGVNKIATYSVISSTVEMQQGPAKVKLTNPEWEVYAPSWVQTLKLPSWPNDKPRDGKKRWDVSFIGSQTTSQPVLGPAMIEAATHVTHSSVAY